MSKEKEIIKWTLSNLEKIKLRLSGDTHLPALLAAIEVIQALSDENDELRSTLISENALLKQSAGIWVDVEDRLPGAIRGRGMVVGLTAAGVLRGLEWYSGKFISLEDGREAFPTHWIDMWPPGKNKVNKGE